MTQKHYIENQRLSNTNPTKICYGMGFNATFNNISVISWWSVPGENQRPVTSHWEILSHHVVSSTPRYERAFELTTLAVRGTDCTGSCKSNYHMITATTAHGWWTKMLRKSKAVLIKERNKYSYNILIS